VPYAVRGARYTGPADCANFQTVLAAVAHGVIWDGPGLKNLLSA
jgi:hypothetical protein